MGLTSDTVSILYSSEEKIYIIEPTRQPVWLNQNKLRELMEQGSVKSPKLPISEKWTRVYKCLTVPCRERSRTPLGDTNGHGISTKLWSIYLNVRRDTLRILYDIKKI